MDDSAQQRQQRASEMPHMVKQVHTLCHSQGVPLQQGMIPDYYPCCEGYRPE